MLSAYQSQSPFSSASILVDAINVLAIWHVQDVLMLVGLALGMGFNYAHKQQADAMPETR